MAANLLDDEMHSYFIQLSIAEKQSVIQLIKTFLHRENEPSGRISIEQYNREIDEALAEVTAGKSYTHDEVKKMSANW